MLAPVAGVFEAQQPLARSASTIATEMIREAILDGRLDPGRRLKEEQLARELGISRTPIREALLVLQSEGLVEALPNRGATVRSHDVEDLDDLYQLRALLEGHAAQRAATRLDSDALVRLRGSCERFERLDPQVDLQEVVRENMLFHSTIHDAAGSARLADMLRKVIDLPLVYRSYIQYSPEQKRISEHYHRQLTAAFEARDADRAQRLMQEHVLEARDLLVAHLRANPPRVEEEAE